MHRLLKCSGLLSVIFLLCVSLFSVREVMADTGVFLSKGQSVYVPVYSHIYSGNKEHPLYLAATLSVRNTDAVNLITITEVTYYNSDGNRLESYLKKPLTLNALAATRFVIDESNKAGGSGASFIVKWKAEKKVLPPVIESVMIGTRSQQGISFTSRGQVIAEK
jgi:uncharacterized protein DUF3124